MVLMLQLTSTVAHEGRCHKSWDSDPAKPYQESPTTYDTDPRQVTILEQDWEADQHRTMSESANTTTE